GAEGREARGGAAREGAAAAALERARGGAARRRRRVEAHAAADERAHARVGTRVEVEIEEAGRRERPAIDAHVLLRARLGAQVELAADRERVVGRLVVAEVGGAALRRAQQALVALGAAGRGGGLRRGRNGTERGSGPPIAARRASVG